MWGSSTQHSSSTWDSIDTAWPIHMGLCLHSTAAPTQHGWSTWGSVYTARLHLHSTARPRGVLSTQHGCIHTAWFVHMELSIQHGPSTWGSVYTPWLHPHGWARSTVSGLSCSGGSARVRGPPSTGEFSGVEQPGAWRQEEHPLLTPPPWVQAPPARCQEAEVQAWPSRLQAGRGVLTCPLWKEEVSYSRMSGRPFRIPLQRPPVDGPTRCMGFWEPLTQGCSHLSRHWPASSRPLRSRSSWSQRSL